MRNERYCKWNMHLMLPFIQQIKSSSKWCRNHLCFELHIIAVICFDELYNQKSICVALIKIEPQTARLMDVWFIYHPHNQYQFTFSIDFSFSECFCFFSDKGPCVCELNWEYTEIVAKTFNVDFKLRLHNHWYRAHNY